MARQYSGTAGRIDNGQVGVFLAYATERGHALIGRRLHLPEDWLDDEHRREGRIPADVAFDTKPTMARAMIAQALDAGVPCARVVADALNGSDKSLRVLLEQREAPDVLAVHGNEVLDVLTAEREFLHLKASALADLVPEDGWKRLGSGVGAKGQRYYDWARLRLFRLQEPPWDHWLLIRRNRKDHADKAYYVTFGPMQTTLADLVRVAGRRRAVEECFEIAKQDCGLADYEVRSWHGWHRHVTLSMLALAFLRPCVCGSTRQEGASRRPLEPIAYSMPEIRHLIGALQRQSPPGIALILGWSVWWRTHQAMARAYHWGRQLMTEQLQL